MKASLRQQWAARDTLAHHSTITLTLDRYTHLRAGDELKTLETLPDLGEAPPPVKPEDKSA